MARSTMSALIQDLRGMTQTAPGDWTLGTANFWDDDQLQQVLDANRTEWYWEAITPVEEHTTGGTASWKRYPLPARHWEASDGGTAVFYLQGADWTAAGTALYSADYRNGVVTFNQTTGGSTYYLTGFSYNLNRAAAAVWRAKADYYATAYDVSTDNHNLRRSQLMAQCEARAARYEQMDGPTSVYAERGDN